MTIPANNQRKVVYASNLTYQVELCREHIHRMADALGGWEALVSPGSTVLLKPNLVVRSQRKANALTDPVIVEAVICLLKDLGIKMTLGDSPSFESAATVAESNGIKSVCKQYDVPIITFHKNIRSTNPEASAWKICQQVSEFDAVINLAKLKGHGQMYFTGGVKNLFGCVAGKTKFLHHMSIGNRGFDFGKMLLEIADLVNPKVTILDGIGAMAGNGPIYGEPISLGLLAMSQDPLALDISVCKLLEADLNRLDIYQAALTDDKWKERLDFEDIWLTAKSVGEGFYFPIEKRPVRFSVSHAIRSVYKTLKKRVSL